VKRFGALSYLGASHPHLAAYMTFGERPDGMYVLYEDYARTVKAEAGQGREITCHPQTSLVH
jgi:hypothetical protein